LFLFQITAEPDMQLDDCLFGAFCIGRPKNLSGDWFSAEDVALLIISTENHIRVFPDCPTICLSI